MSQVDPIPGPDTLASRREPKYIIDPKEVTATDEARVKAWAAAIMAKHERFFTDKIRDRTIVARGEVSAEEIDIRNIYPFPDLNWIIYRRNIKFGTLWNLMLLSKGVVLFVSSFAKV